MMDREEYLLGRPIDKSFEQMVEAEKNNELNHAPRNHVEHECVPPSLRFFSGNEQVDLARKMQEDPLYAIKKKEIETRNQLLKNPVKLKQLRQLLEQQSEKDKNEKKQKKRKRKKHSQDENSSDDDIQLDMLLAAKYKQLKDKLGDKKLIKSMKRVKHKRHKKLKKENSSSSSESKDSSTEDSDSENLAKYKKRKRNKSGDDDNTIQPHRDKREKYTVKEQEDNKQKILEKERIKKHSWNNERSNVMDYKKKGQIDKRETYRNRNQDYRPKMSQDVSNFSKYVSNKNSERSSSNVYTPKKYKESEQNTRKYLTDEEKERRRQEMVSNAAWRDKEREKNVKKYREEEKKEVDTNKTYNQDFIRKQLVTATEVGTVASRIKSNINNIQRSGRAMDTNFAKR